MALIWWEIALLVALNAAVLAGFGLVVVKGWLPGKEKELLSKGEVWMGGAIGRFMANLSEKAAEEEGSEGSSSAGELNVGGFKITPDLINSIAQLAQIAQQFGLIKGGTGGGTNPFLKG